MSQTIILGLGVEGVFQAEGIANTTAWRQECAGSFKKSYGTAVAEWSKHVESDRR